MADIGMINPFNLVKYI